MYRTDAETAAIVAIESQAWLLEGRLDDYDRIIEAARDRHFALLGEASHGTAEFYRIRAEITMRLIEEAGYDAVAVEADWPDAYEINRYVSAQHPDMSAESALKRFERFPTWMWANEEVLHFIRWLHEHNMATIRKGSRDRPVGFYGLDLYSMATSAHAVIEYLAIHDPAAAQRARKRYGCLGDFIHRPQAYGKAMDFGLTKSCEHAITAQLIELRHKAWRYMSDTGIVDGDEYFCAEQNAKLVRNAEHYYRTMFHGRPGSWNLRDRHMFETLGELRQHLSAKLGREARIVVWAHNSHLGNAAATDMAKRGEFNIGQLVRESHGSDALLVGFSTSTGEVTAASEWDMPAARKIVRKPLRESYEWLFHQVRLKAFLLDLGADTSMTDLLLEPRLERAIGVIYRPESERQSHYFHACLPEQFDFLIHIDETKAVRPLHIPAAWHRGELDETWPTGL
ncbi:erythromycin esterase family protein [Pseudokordiimonas caeni]|uniref:erythromycin esterase family protein n=1 Tax=Pseudokordiimonas caeni TaxID=2997908 RepID=UPI002811EFCD|nr:erythromycin esterase family protein [Pseudokordiimonas caeni]